MTRQSPEFREKFIAAAVEPGSWVCHPARPDWGAGQVQSVIGARVTVNFAHAGKVLVNAAEVSLQTLEGPPGLAPPDGAAGQAKDRRT